MKTILSGIELNRYLNFRTLVSKCVGLVMAYASGLSIGKEGPFVHIASILCSLLSKLPFFKYIRQNNAAYMQVLSAATAVGVTSAFGTPVGGVFFSMEVTSTFYHVENLWRAFFVSITAKLISVILSQFMPFGLDLFEVKLGFVQWQLIELIPFAFMGILFGILSGAFVRLMTLVFRLSRIHPRLQTAYGQLGRAATVCLVLALIAFPVPLMRNDNSIIVPYLVAPLTDHQQTWQLALFCFAKFVTIIFSVAFTGAAAGVFGPVFLEGAFLGRLCGELMSIMFPKLDVSPTAYAIVGAAAFASGVTRTISTALIVVELTFQIHLMLPVLVAVLLANFVGRMLSLSVYSVLIQAKDLPQLPRFKLYNQATNRTAGEIMRTKNVRYLHSNATFGEALELVSSSDFPSFPLVDADGYFCGIVRRAKLASALKHAGFSTESRSIGDIGHGVIERAARQWDEKNHTYDTQTKKVIRGGVGGDFGGGIASGSVAESAPSSARHHPLPMHLEPEDIEHGLMKGRHMEEFVESGSPPSEQHASFAGGVGTAITAGHASSNAITVPKTSSSPTSRSDILIDTPSSFGRKADEARRSRALSATLESPSSSSYPPPLSSSPSKAHQYGSIDGQQDVLPSTLSSFVQPQSPLGLEPSSSYSFEQTILNAPVPFIFNASQSNISDLRMIDVDTTVLTISPETSVTKVHFMFTVLGISHIFIVRRGKLLGLITRKDLIKAIASMNYQKR